METTIAITVKDVYGQTLVYPANDQAKRLATMLGTKTFTHAAMCGIEAMGFRILEVDRLGKPIRANKLAA
jgi:hypothetical protein